MSAIKKICICAICIALCYVLPTALHPLGFGKLFSPLHVPVLICGMACGAGYGLVCGIIGPLLVSTLTGMPTMLSLSVMLPEIAVYGIFSGIFMRSIRTGSLLLNSCLTLIPTLLLGRAAAALATAAFYTLGLFGVESFSLSKVISTYFISSVPTMAIHMVFIPLFVVTLKEEKLIKL